MQPYDWINEFDCGALVFANQKYAVSLVFVHRNRLQTKRGAIYNYKKSGQALCVSHNLSGLLFVHLLRPGHCVGYLKIAKSLATWVRHLRLTPSRHTMRLYWSIVGSLVGVSRVWTRLLRIGIFFLFSFGLVCVVVIKWSIAWHTSFACHCFGTKGMNEWSEALLATTRNLIAT